jgi:NAD(P)-dependent dehydrogenase (short-subunit alcohol dehydrogenase family)
VSYGSGMGAPIALVTGASRGIGKASAIALAEAGFDVAISARTMRAGEVRENSVRAGESDMRPIPGSLEETADLIEATGQRSIAIQMDLLDRASVGAGMTTLLERWGPIDLLLHNGRYVGPGQFETILETSVEALENFLEAHVMAQLILTQMALPGMIERGSGVIMTMSSGSAYRDVPFPPGKGGWGLAYSVGKAAGHRLVPHIKAEFADRGIRSYNITPGYVRTERNAMVDSGLDAKLEGREWAPPEAIGAVVVWLATSPDAVRYDGTNVEAQPLCRELGLFPL